jgi:hypothetical protein
MPSQPVGAWAPVGTGLRTALRSRSRVARGARAIARWSALTAGAALAVFHIFLFWDRLVGGDLFDPAIAVKWLAAACLVSALMVLRRMGIPLTQGRKACVVWLLVVLLHASSRSVPVVQEETSGLDASVIFVLPSTLAVVGLGLLCATTVRRRPLAFAAVGRVAEPAARSRLSDGWRRGGTTRAPPLAAF